MQVEVSLTRNRNLTGSELILKNLTSTITCGNRQHTASLYHEGQVFSFEEEQQQTLVLQIQNQQTKTMMYVRTIPLKQVLQHCQQINGPFLNWVPVYTPGDPSDQRFDVRHPAEDHEPQVYLSLKMYARSSYNNALPPGSGQNLRNMMPASGGGYFPPERTTSSAVNQVPPHPPQPMGAAAAAFAPNSPQNSNPGVGSYGGAANMIVPGNIQRRNSTSRGNHPQSPPQSSELLANNYRGQTTITAGAPPGGLAAGAAGASANNFVLEHQQFGAQVGGQNNLQNQPAPNMYSTRPQTHAHLVGGPGAPPHVVARQVLEEQTQLPQSTPSLRSNNQQQTAPATLNDADLSEAKWMANHIQRHMAQSAIQQQAVEKLQNKNKSLEQQVQTLKSELQMTKHEAKMELEKVETRVKAKLTQDLAAERNEWIRINTEKSDLLQQDLDRAKVEKTSLEQRLSSYEKLEHELRARGLELEKVKAENEQIKRLRDTAEHETNLQKQRLHETIQKSSFEKKTQKEEMQKEREHFQLLLKQASDKHEMNQTTIQNQFDAEFVVLKEKNNDLELKVTTLSAHYENAQELLKQYELDLVEEKHGAKLLQENYLKQEHALKSELDQTFKRVEMIEQQGNKEVDTLRDSLLMEKTQRAAEKASAADQIRKLEQAIQGRTAELEQQRRETETKLMEQQKLLADKQNLMENELEKTRSSLLLDKERAVQSLVEEKNLELAEKNREWDTKYQDMKNSYAKDLDTTTALTQQQQNALQHELEGITKEKKQLQDLSDRLASEKQKLESEKRSLEMTISGERSKQDKQATELATREKQAADQLAALRAELVSLQEKADEERQTLDREKLELESTLAAKAQAASALEKEKLDLLEKMKERQSEFELQKSLTSHESEQKLQDAQKEFQKELQGMQTQVMRLEMEKKNAEKGYAERLEAEREKLVSENNQSAEKYNSYIDTMEQHSQSLQQELDNVKIRSTDLEQSVSALQHEKHEQQQSMERAKQDADRKVQDLTQQLYTEQTKAEILRKDKQALESEVLTLKQSVASGEQKMANFQEEVQQLRSFQQQTNSATSEQMLQFQTELQQEFEKKFSLQLTNQREVIEQKDAQIIALEQEKSKHEQDVDSLTEMMQHAMVMEEEKNTEIAILKKFIADNVDLSDDNNNVLRDMILKDKDSAGNHHLLNSPGGGAAGPVAAGAATTVSGNPSGNMMIDPSSLNQMMMMRMTPPPRGGSTNMFQPSPGPVASSGAGNINVNVLQQQGPAPPQGSSTFGISPFAARPGGLVGNIGLPLHLPAVGLTNPAGGPGAGPQIWSSSSVEQEYGGGYTGFTTSTAKSAIVVGCNYPNVRNAGLQHANADAMQIARCFEQSQQFRGGAGIRVLTDTLEAAGDVSDSSSHSASHGTSTCHNIFHAIEDVLVKNSNPTEHLFFYFSGYGSSMSSSSSSHVLDTTALMSHSAASSSPSTAVLLPADFAKSLPAGFVADPEWKNSVQHMEKHFDYSPNKTSSNRDLTQVVQGQVQRCGYRFFSIEQLYQWIRHCANRRTTASGVPELKKVTLILDAGLLVTDHSTNSSSGAAPKRVRVFGQEVLVKTKPGATTPSSIFQGFFQQKSDSASSGTSSGNRHLPLPPFPVLDLEENFPQPSMNVPSHDGIEIRVICPKHSCSEDQTSGAFTKKVLTVLGSAASGAAAETLSFQQVAASSGTAGEEVFVMGGTGSGELFYS
ncbi:unnamed protein product [Amoebophrya sp. A120]|nr:unnamed protein product [Amoebophrya sp. A120]|eukprot:GSA120T00020550001.1